MAQFSNQATLTYNGVTAVSNITTGEITQAIIAWKDATYDQYQPGDILTYVISLQNSSPNTLTGITVTDNLGAYSFGTGTVVPLTYTGDPVLYYSNGILQTAPPTTAGPPLVISNITVYAGLSVLLVYRVQVNGYAPLGAGTSIENTATISGGGLTTSVVASETVTANAGADLRIAKMISSTTPLANSPVTYTFAIENSGPVPTTAASNLIVSDTFNPPLTGALTVTLNGATLPQSGNYTYNAVTGVFATVSGVVTVPAASYAQDPITGLWTTTPGQTTMTVTGII